MPLSSLSVPPLDTDPPRKALLWWLSRATLALLAALVLACLYWRNPAYSRIFPPCPFYWLTGLYCPGCGSLRALHFLFHGQLCAALGMNPLLIFSLPLLGVLFLK